MTATAFRLSCLYAALFTVVGVNLPFWPVWLAAKGLDATAIGVVVAVAIGIKVVGNPVVAHLADARGERKRIMVGLGLLALAAFALFALTDGFWAILAVTVVFSAAFAALHPLGESLTMLAVQAERLDYGRIRLWGSLSFIAAALVAGWALAGRPAAIVLVLVLGALALSLAATLALPDLRAPKAGARFALLDVLKDRAFVLFMAAATLVQASHGVYYAFGTLHWRSVGYSEAAIGALWAEGVIAEIVLFAWGRQVIAALGPIGLIVLGGAAGALRWTATGLSDALPVLVAAQALHAFTFGAAHLGAIHFIAQWMPPALSASAQSVYSSLVMGLGLGLATLAAGPLYESYGAGAYLAPAALGLAGALLALPLLRRWRERGAP
jgi:PPP family 3-phenylpropionic acid transporter